MNKWQLVRYIIDAKKDVDSISFISKSVLLLRNLDLRKIINYKLTEFYINLCIVYDKSLGSKKSQLKKSDKIIEETYYQRDKNYAHKDEDYKKVEIQYDLLIATMQEQLQYCVKQCSNSLPEELTLDYVCYDRDLYRFINKIDYEKEEEIKKQSFPNYHKNDGNLLKPLKVFEDTEDIKNISNNENYAIIFDTGICEEEGLQNRQDSCIKFNVLHNTNVWCSLRK